MKSTDRGKTWDNITGDLPERGSVESSVLILRYGSARNRTLSYNSWPLSSVIVIRI